MGRCPGPASGGWCAPLGLRLLSPPGPAHGDRETSIIKKRMPDFGYRDRIRHGGDDDCRKDADSSRRAVRATGFEPQRGELTKPRPTAWDEVASQISAFSPERAIQVFRHTAVPIPPLRAPNQLSRRIPKVAGSPRGRLRRAVCVRLKGVVPPLQGLRRRLMGIR